MANAIPEPHAEPHSAKASPRKPTDDMLSPVSKLELARKYAAEEQQKRVEQACERMVVAKKAQHVKEVHVEQETTEVVETKSGRLSSIAMRLVDAFKSTTDENDADAANAKENDELSASPTRQLLHATRNKLNSIVAQSEPTEDDNANLPATNYHLKQLGLADEKVNIYAPIHEQQSELRRRRESAIRCQEKYMQQHAEIDEGYKSTDDSDFAPEDDDDDASDDDAADDWRVDEEEVRGLIHDQSQQPRSAAMLKRLRKQAARLSLPTILAIIIVTVLAIIAAVFVSEQQSGFCRQLVAQVPQAEEGRLVTCGVVLQVHEALLPLYRLLPLQQ